MVCHKEVWTWSQSIFNLNRTRIHFFTLLHRFLVEEQAFRKTLQAFKKAIKDVWVFNARLVCSLGGKRVREEHRLLGHWQRLDRLSRFGSPLCQCVSNPPTQLFVVPLFHSMIVIIALAFFFSPFNIIL